MFRLFRKTRIKEYARECEQYVQKMYTEPKRYFEAPKSTDAKQDSGTQTGEIRTPIHGPRYSVCDDDYDEESIMRTMKEMSSSMPPARILGMLDAYTNMSFVDKLLEHINKRHLRDSEVYKAAQVDRRLFSKIVSDREYKPAKDTCIAFAFALQLTLSEAEDLLSRAGYTLSHSNKRDVMIEYFFKVKIHDLTDINEVLYRLDQKVIGRT